MTAIEMEPTQGSIDAAAAWQAVVKRDQSHDGRFVFAVRTTGIYCRPSCPSRQANRANVEFFADPATARAAGYRSCRRCRPDQPAVDPLLLAKAALEASGGSRLTLDALARQVGLSPSHLQRRFKARFGLSPRQFQSAQRSSNLRAALRNGRSVSRATYQSGYGSSSRVYENTDARLGMTPARFARGGAGLEIRYLLTDTTLGKLLVAVTDRGVSAVLIGTEDNALIASLASEFPGASIVAGNPDADQGFRQLVARVAEAMTGNQRPGEIPLDIMGSAFQEAVWRALQEIPTGETATYREVAEHIGRPAATRAVARAIARNRLAVLIPCHRVVRSDGGLGGYRWGTAVKQRLLDAERRAGSSGATTPG